MRWCLLFVPTVAVAQPAEPTNDPPTEPSPTEPAPGTPRSGPTSQRNNNYNPPPEKPYDSDADTSRRVGHFLLGFDLGGMRPFGHDRCEGCARTGGAQVAIEVGLVLASRIALVAHAFGANSNISESRDGFSSMQLVGLVGAARVWPIPRVWVEAGLGAGSIAYRDATATDRVSLGTSLVPHVGTGVEIASFARWSLGGALAFEGVFADSVRLIVPSLAFSLRYYTGLGPKTTKPPCNFSPHKGCMNI